MPDGAQDRAFADVQAELAHERGRALGRAGRKVEHHLDRCHELLALAPAAAGDDDEAGALLADYRAARRELDHALWAFCVQREAIGLDDHTWVHRIYVAPPSVATLRARLAAPPDVAGISRGGTAPS